MFKFKTIAPAFQDYLTQMNSSIVLSNQEFVAEAKMLGVKDSGFAEIFNELAEQVFVQAILDGRIRLADATTHKIMYVDFFAAVVKVAKDLNTNSAQDVLAFMNKQNYFRGYRDDFKYSSLVKCLFMFTLKMERGEASVEEFMQNFTHLAIEGAVYFTNLGWTHCSCCSKSADYHQFMGIIKKQETVGEQGFIEIEIPYEVAGCLDEKQSITEMQVTDGVLWFSDWFRDDAGKMGELFSDISAKNQFGEYTANSAAKWMEHQANFAKEGIVCIPTYSAIDVLQKGDKLIFVDLGEEDGEGNIEGWKNVGKVSCDLWRVSGVEKKSLQNRLTAMGLNSEKEMNGMCQVEVSVNPGKYEVVTDTFNQGFTSFVKRKDYPNWFPVLEGQVAFYMQKIA